MLAMGKDQPDLLTFLMAYTEDVHQAAKELAIYIAFGIYYIFRDLNGKIQKISSRGIIVRYDENTRFLESLESAHDKIIDRIAKVTVSKQPYVMKYVLEALTEDSREDSIDLTDDDIGLLFMPLKTEIEILDNSA
jgi:hypothetical protein